MLNLADFALQEQLEGNLMVAISRAWYNGSYTIAAKPIKSLELHYTMIQFLINNNITYYTFSLRATKKKNESSIINNLRLKQQQQKSTEKEKSRKIPSRITQLFRCITSFYSPVPKC